MKRLLCVTLKTAACGDPNSINGGLPVAISTMVQPRDQISACLMKYDSFSILWSLEYRLVSFIRTIINSKD